MLKFTPIVRLLPIKKKRRKYAVECGYHYIGPGFSKKMILNVFVFTASTIWESGKDKRNPDEFLLTLRAQLGDFGFPEEFIFDVWGIILDNRNKNTF